MRGSEIPFLNFVVAGSLCFLAQKKSREFSVHSSLVGKTPSYRHAKCIRLVRKKRSAEMLQAHSEQVARVQRFKADEQTLADLGPGAAFSARASFQALGERQFSSDFAGGLGKAGKIRNRDPAFHS
jgi:hypothetical protein